MVSSENPNVPYLTSNLKGLAAPPVKSSVCEESAVVTLFRGVFGSPLYENKKRTESSMR